jgi:hypothetical protein
METSSGVLVEVGGIAVRLNTSNRLLVEVLEQRFRRFLNAAAQPQFEFDLTVVDPASCDEDADLDVRFDGRRWILRRGDFHAEFDRAARRGTVRQTLNPYAIDSVLRIVHSLVLSTEGGFLLHASSAVRNNRAFLFTGPSGAGKSTIAKLAPSDATVLTDEISYVRRVGGEYVAYGTPFAGELADVGEPAAARVAALFQLGHAHENTREALEEKAAVCTLMRNILFFAHDRTLISHVLDTACDFAARVPAYRLAFVPDNRVWQDIS